MASLVPNTGGNDWRQGARPATASLSGYLNAGSFCAFAERLLLGESAFGIPWWVGL